MTITHGIITEHEDTHERGKREDVGTRVLPPRFLNHVVDVELR